ncbi:MAG TPA: hypothetical protein VG148_14065, partial [Pyrinomonadaceae bacterium]|nr:hypothetical protein [Pyrinomonadaceae bacterium]
AASAGGGAAAKVSRAGAGAAVSRVGVKSGVSSSPAATRFPHCGQNRAPARTDAPQARQRREISGSDMKANDE